MVYRVEYAKTNRAGCGVKACKDAKVKIMKGELRLGTWIENENFSSYVWRHWGCVTPKQLANMAQTVVENYDEIDGFEDLTPEDQERVKTAVKAGHVADEDLTEGKDPAANQPPEDKKAAKEAEKAAKQAQKDAAKEAKKAEKEAAKEAKKAEKEAEKEAKKEAKKAAKEDQQSVKKESAKAKKGATEPVESQPSKGKKRTAKSADSDLEDGAVPAKKPKKSKANTLPDTDGAADAPAPPRGSRQKSSRAAAFKPAAPVRKVPRKK